MYIVVSTWNIVDGKSEAAQHLGREMRARLRAVDGIELIEHFESGSEVVVIVCYRDESTYRQIIEDPDGVFHKGLAELDLESAMTWKQSWRGEAVPH